MKLRIQKLSRSEYRKNIEEYRKTPNGSQQLSRLLRMRILGIFLLIYSIYSIIDNIIVKAQATKYIYPIFLLLGAIFFIIASIRLKTESLNNFYIKNKNSK